MDNDQDEDYLFSIAVALLALDLRGDVVEQQCTNWRSHVHRLRRESYFSHFCRMSCHSFQKLLTMLRPSLLENCHKSHN